MRAFAILVLLGLAVSLDASPQGLGGGLTGRRLNVTLTRKAASLVSLSGNTVRLNITVAAQGTVPRQYADVLRTRLTAEVFKDPRVVEELKTPDAIVEATINEFTYNQRVNARTNFDFLKRANVTTQTRVVDGLIVLSYRTLNGRDKKGLDAGNLRFGFEQEFTIQGQPYRELGRKKEEAFNHLPTRQEVDQYLIDGMVNLVAKRIVAVDEPITVPLPLGRLEPASRLGAASRWGAMIEELEKMPALTPVADDAYRQYALGVANEALAYQETDARQKQDFLAKAALGYKNAIRMNAAEGVFQAAQNRIATYSAPDPVGPGEPAHPAAAPSAGGSTSRSTGTNVLRNDDVIKLATEKFSEEFILDAIGTAKQVDFDVSTNGLIALKRAGVSEKIIQAMRNRVK
jgi:hypothetical protein